MNSLNIGLGCVTFTEIGNSKAHKSVGSQRTPCWAPAPGSAGPVISGVHSHRVTPLSGPGSEFILRRRLNTASATSLTLVSSQQATFHGESNEGQLRLGLFSTVQMSRASGVSTLTGTSGWSSPLAVWFWIRDTGFAEPNWPVMR